MPFVKHEFKNIIFSLKMGINGLLHYFQLVKKESLLDCCCSEHS